MEERTARKMKAAAKIAFGVGKGVGAVMMATGHGFIGAALKQRHMMGMAARIASANMKSARKTIEDGLNDWEQN